MTAAVQRVTLLLSRRMQSIFWDKVRYSALQDKYLSPLYLVGQNQLFVSKNLTQSLFVRPSLHVHLQTDQVHIKQLFHWRAHQQKQGCHSRHQRQVRISPPHFLFSQPTFFLRPPAPTYPSAASSGRRNSISISSSTNMASMSSNTSSSMAATSSRRRHVSMSSTASYGTPAASRGLPFY